MQTPVITNLQLPEANVLQALLRVKWSYSSPYNLPGLFLSKLACLSYPTCEYSPRRLNMPAFVNIGNKQLSYHFTKEKVCALTL